MILNFQNTSFVKSAFKPADFPLTSKAEIAFAGRSNVGKSSTLNLLTQNRKLAKVSKTPGRTTSINFFTVAEDIFLVDLPGYGYAKVSHSIKAHWQNFLQTYITKRQSLQGIILVMDCRHPFTELDLTFLDLCAIGNRSCHILLNKADKLSNNQKTQIMHKLVKPVLDEYNNLSIQFFSASNGQGLEELKTKLKDWILPPANVTNVT